MTPLEQLTASFWSRVNRDGPNGCWIWTGGRVRDGYGAITVRGKQYGTHRVAYELVKGAIPDGLQLDHLCRNPPCCNPDHLEPVTALENQLRGEGVAARNARKTHCVRGHEFTPDNTMRRGQWRRCRQCHNTHSREWWRNNVRVAV